MSGVMVMTSVVIQSRTSSFFIIAHPGVEKVAVFVGSLVSL
jgi:hypothetical protein